MPFPNNSFENNQDQATRKGIIILGVVLFLIIGFFIWYNYRLSGSRSSEIASSDQKEGFLSNLFSGNNSNSASSNDDSDNDGLSSDEEKKVNTDPLKIDSDNDGLTDGEEVKTYHTNPTQADSDGDGIKDGEEIKDRHNPLDPSPNAVWPPVPTTLSPNK